MSTIPHVNLARGDLYHLAAYTATLIKPPGNRRLGMGEVFNLARQHSRCITDDPAYGSGKCFGAHVRCSTSAYSYWGRPVPANPYCNPCKITNLDKGAVKDQPIAHLANTNHSLCIQTAPTSVDYS